MGIFKKNRQLALCMAIILTLCAGCGNGSQDETNGPTDPPIIDPSLDIIPPISATPSKESPRPGQDDTDQPKPTALPMISELRSYRAVLLNKQRFYSTDANREYYLNEYDFGNEAGQPYEIERFSAVDMDGDGIVEIVLEISSDTGDRLLLRHEGGTVYGFAFPLRLMKWLKKDGSFESSESSQHVACLKLEFNAGTYIEEELWYSYGDFYDPSKSVYRIAGEEVTVDDVYAGWGVQSAKEDVDWYRMTTENVDLMFSGF